MCVYVCMCVLVYANSGRYVPLKETNMARLFTAEDRFHAHKLLGVSVLVHFVYRAFLISYTGRDAFEDTDAPAALACLGMHVALHLTSFIFHIP